LQSETTSTLPLSLEDLIVASGELFNISVIVVVEDASTTMCDMRRWYRSACNCTSLGTPSSPRSSPSSAAPRGEVAIGTAGPLLVPMLVDAFKDAAVRMGSEI
jgi:hypothetical protein